MAAAHSAQQPTTARGATRSTHAMAPGSFVGAQLAATKRAAQSSTSQPSSRRISSRAAVRRVPALNHHRSKRYEANLNGWAPLVAVVGSTIARHRRHDNTRAASSPTSGTSAALSLAALVLATMFLLAPAADDFAPLVARFALESSASAESSTTSPRSSGSPPSASSSSSASSRSGGAGSPFIWQPLPLRATFRPLNRQARPAASEQPAVRPARLPRPTTSAPSPPGPLALSLSERSISGETLSGDNALSGALASASGSARSGLRDSPFSASFFQPQPAPFESAGSVAPLAAQPSGPASSATVTAAPASSSPPPDEDDELPTRQPMMRFRPTRAPSDDADTNFGPSVSSPATLAASRLPSGGMETSNADWSAAGNGSISGGPELGISRECFECICDASTNCNSQSRCQTSDVRHTRCGLFLISYDQWLASGLSRELVSREALQRDAAADERAFYDCVTQRDCAQRLLTIYMERHRKDCDKDGRVDCYDMAAIHHSGMDQCASESLLDSQYWNDFNACLGFGR